MLCQDFVSPPEHANLYNYAVNNWCYNKRFQSQYFDPQ